MPNGADPSGSLCRSNSPVCLSYLATTPLLIIAAHTPPSPSASIATARLRSRTGTICGNSTAPDELDAGSTYPILPSRTSVNHTLPSEGSTSRAMPACPSNG